MRVKLVFILLVIIGHLASGQKLISQSEHVELFQQQSTDSLVTLNSSNTITALAIKSESEGVFKLVLGEEERMIPRDPDVDDPTYFISLENPTKEIILLVREGIDFDIYLIASSQPPAFSPDQFRNSQSNECNDPPPAVPQSTWRSGLPEPNYTRSFHEVFHNVIHHSAGSNTNTNYTQVVRDIYLYHTEVNGWSDIGYNYLIAQNGTLYTGRDPGNGSQDNVRGAHFCGANSGTLGICLLGNYETATVTASTWETLESLVTFELLDQGRDPFDSFNHSLGSLGTIVGHRDGCATLCPGENVYNQLMTFKSTVDAKMQECIEPELLTIKTDTTLVKVAETVVYQAQGDYEEFEWILPGALPRTWRGESVSATYAVPGTMTSH
ncbi:N-acetylmuramoyl-L-alanine amidase [Ekhidna sp.]|uniref:N-acetylmuramoyl-L-alanine amidase n=1 Tax=Ekhidna sp. TaxID=2608089 RepID=UPI0032EE986F